MIGVWDATGTFAAAVAELPLSVEAASGAAGAIAVVADAAGLRSALDAGARGAVLSAPDPAAASGDRPVVVLRPRLRAVPVGDQAAVVAECSAPPTELEAVLGDAVGWVRMLTGHAPVLRSAEVGLALLDAGGVPVTVLARPLSGVPSGGVIRVLALGTERREIEVDEPAGVLRITTAREGGTAGEPPRFESDERVALRRMIAALTSGEAVTDLADLAGDTRTARAILGVPG